MMSEVPRISHDGLYRAIDMYLKVHPSISKSERRCTCKLIDCRKFLPDACMHVIQNEQLPLRVIVQVLFFEQERAAASFGSSTPDLPKGIRNLNSLSRRSSRSTTTANNGIDWDASRQLSALKAEMASLRLSNVSRVERNGVDGTALKRVKGTLRSRKMLSGKGQGENSGSTDMSES